MKKVNQRIIMCAAVTALLFSNTKTVAQDVADAERLRRFEFGVRFMPTFSKLNLTSTDGGTVKGSAKLNFGAGGLVGFSFTKHVEAQVEVIYTSITQKYTENNKEESVNLKYMNFPVLFRFNTNKTKRVNLNLVAGPQIGLSIGGSYSITAGTDSTASTTNTDVKAGDFGFAYGGGLDIALNPSRSLNLGIGYRGVYGLVDVSNNNKNTSNNSSYVLDKTHIVTNAFYFGVSVLF